MNLLAVVPVAVAVAGVLAVLVGRGSAGRSVVVTGTAGVVSLAATVGVVVLGHRFGAKTAASGLAVAETAALLVLIVVVVRAAPIRQAMTAGGIAGMAVATWVLRFGPASISVATFTGCAAWAMVAIVAAAVGLYLRSLDDRRSRSVAEARRAQRLGLARDLHDFVAHDVSGMLAQAQAGQIVAEADPAAAVAAFRRIEEAALMALTSLDKTVHMLHETGEPTTSLPGLADLQELTDRFAGTSAIRLEIAPELAGGTVPREVDATVYRVVVEALTNVRRHASAASLVNVAVRLTHGAGGPVVEVAVTDDARTDVASALGAAGRRGGLGLPGLAERVEALGGILTAGPHDPRGWRVAAVLPLADAPSGPGVRPVAR